jgi:adenosine/AMP kinase
MAMCCGRRHEEWHQSISRPMGRCTDERKRTMQLKLEQLEFPEGCNIIVGQTHFIKTVEDLYEVMVGSVPTVKFGIAFCEASGHCLLRIEGNDDEMKRVAEKNALKVSAGHTFFLVMRDAFPINVLNQIKMCPEVCHVFCATANPVQVIIAESEQGRGVLGVIDGSSPKGVEKEEDVAWRKNLLRQFKYKL